ncbi:MAG TPA: amidase [Burkholderiales bacterium]|nr:amidase [Burkholderiales bacterium]
MNNDLCALPATELLDAYRKRELSPVEVATAVRRRVDELNPVLNAFCLVSEDFLDGARQSEARWKRGEPQGLLDGVPVSIKDLLLTRGWPTLRGSKTIDPRGPWNDDAPVVARLREHGALFIGKTTTPEFGWKGVTDNPLTGITRNPWDPAKTPGGSSGGAAAALAAGMGPLALGTDGGGSIRIPCSFTGLFGLKPSFGRVPAWPLSPFGTVAHVGPMARTVADAALMLNVLSLPDARDWHALPYDDRDYRMNLEQGVRGLRVAFSPDLGYAKVDPEVASLVKKSIKVFEDLGAKVEEKHPGFREVDALFRTHWFSGAAYMLKDKNKQEKDLMDPGLIEVASQGAKITATEILDAQMKRGALGMQMNLFHRDYDLLLTPTLAVPAFEVGREFPGTSRDERWTDWTPFSYPFNLTQQPAASIPCGFTKGGLPVGLQIVGPRYADALVLRAARAFESARPLSFPDLSRLKAPAR